MNRRFIHLLVSVCLGFTTSCIHINSREKKDIQLSTTKSNALVHTQINDLKLDSLIFAKDKWPLMNFVSHLSKGQLKKAFQNFDIEYISRNTNDEVLRRLISQGLVPVYIKIENTGMNSIHLTSGQFLMHTDDQVIKPVRLENVPRTFNKFSSAAAMANVYNVSVVTISFIALLTVLAYATQGHMADLGPLGEDWGNGAVINPTTHRTEINYKDLLFDTLEIKPGQKIERLLIFDVGPDINSESLVFTPQ